MNRTCFTMVLAFLSLSSIRAEISTPSGKPFISLDGEINDRNTLALLTTQSEKMLKEGRTTRMEDLLTQLDRKRRNLKLPKSLFCVHVP